MLASAEGLGGAFNSDFLRPEQENILAIARFENSIGNKQFPRLSMSLKGHIFCLREEQIGQLLAVAQTQNQ